MRKFRKGMLALAAICLLPIAGLMLSAGVAALAGCELNEGVEQACVVLGLDIGGLLTTLFVGGWFAFFAIPLLMGLLVLWALVEVTALLRERRRTRRNASDIGS